MSIPRDYTIKGKDHSPAGKRKRRYEVVLDNIQQQPNSKNKKKVLEFLEYLKVKKGAGLAVSTQIGYAEMLLRLLAFTKKDFETLEEKDLVSFVGTFNGCTVRQIYTLSFFKWINGDEEYPKCIKFLKGCGSRRDLTTKTSADIWTTEEIKKLATAADNPKERAMVLIWYESAGRSGELLNLRIKDVTFDDYGAVLKLDGKTGKRNVRLVNSAVDLKEWVNHHPNKDDPEAPLWINTSMGFYGEALGQQGPYMTFMRLGRRAGIKKKITPHLLRHSRLTELAERGWADTELKVFSGWSMSSRMPAVYLHPQEEKIQRKIIEMNGKLKPEDKAEKEKEQKELEASVCIKCGKQNSAIAKFCLFCSAPLKLEDAIETGDQKNMINAIVMKAVARYIDNPHNLQEAMKGLTKKELDLVEQIVEVRTTKPK